MFAGGQARAHMNDINRNRTISVAEYHELARTGVLTEDNNVELLEGKLVEKMTKNRAHSLGTRRTRSRLEAILPTGWYVDSQEPITTEDSEPEPDVSVIEGEPERYDDRQPFPAEAALIAEVADTSLHNDRTVKKTIYARARIPVYWIVNLVDRQIEVYTLPSGPNEQPDYSKCDIYRAGDQVPVVVRGQEVGRIPVAALLP